MRDMAMMVIFCAVLLEAGCGNNVLMEVVSPDKDRSIVVRSRDGVDPPAQDIILKDLKAHTEAVLDRLKEDRDWVRQVKWHDNDTVYVLVSDYKINIYDAPGKVKMNELILVKGADKKYPPGSVSNFEIRDDKITYLTVEGNVTNTNHIGIGRAGR